MVLITLVLIAAVLLWRAPSTLVSSRIEQLTQGQVVLGESEGTVWRGSGVAAIGGARVPLSWQVDPKSVVRGEVALAIRPAAGGTNPSGDVVVGDKRATAHALDLALPASALIPLIVPRPRLDVRGTVELHSPNIAWNPNAMQGSVTLDWRDAGVGLAGGTPVALGDVSADLAAVDGQLTGPLRNRGGEFALDGVLTVAPNGGGTIRATIRPRAPDDRRLDALAPLGRTDGSSVAVEWRWPGR